MDNSTSDEDHEVPFFDTYATSLYIFDDMNRVEAENLLRVGDVGTFLIRKSSKKNSYSLSLRVSLEDEKSILHFIIEQRTTQDGLETVFHMNGADYRNIPTLVTHFTINKLGSSKHSTFLRQPAPKLVIEMVKGTHRFFGERATDLPFNVGERLEILEKPEEEWWIARNAMGGVGFVPTNYFERDSCDDPEYEQRVLSGQDDNDPYYAATKTNSSSQEPRVLVRVTNEI